MKEAIINAQKTCDMMVKDAESKCTQMLNNANVMAAENVRSNDALIAAEDKRLEDARKATTEEIEKIEAQLKACLEQLAKIRQENTPAPEAPAVEESDDYASEISQNLEALVGTTEDTAPKAEPKHPVSETTSKFTNLQFGRNYDPTKK